MSKKGNHRNQGPALWVTAFDDESAIRFNIEAWQMFQDDPVGPLIVHIDSPGGGVYSLLSMLETMDNIRAVAPEEFFIITYVHGCAFSCGIFLAAHGDLRVATPKSELMFHEISDGIRGREHQITIQHENLVRLTDKLYSIFADDTDFKGGFKALRKWGERDQWLTPQEAKKLGIIDVIGYVKPKGYSTTVSPPSIGECEGLSLRKKHSKEAKKPSAKKSKKSKK